MTADFRRTVVFVSLVYAGFAVVLWPEESYAQILRFGGAPSFVTALPYALSLGAAITALLLDSTRISPIVTAVVSLALQVPLLTLGSVVGRVPFFAFAAVLFLLFAVAVFFASFRALVLAIPTNPTLQGITLWGGSAALLVIGARSVPQALPSAVVRASLVYGDIPRVIVWYPILALFFGIAGFAVHRAKRPL